MTTNTVERNEYAAGRHAGILAGLLAAFLVFPAFAGATQGEAKNIYGTPAEGQIAYKGKTDAGKTRTMSDVEQDFPGITQLIQHTKSMTDKERQYWFSVLPTMNYQQRASLYNLLKNEEANNQKIRAMYREYQQQQQQQQMSPLGEKKKK